MAKKQRTLIDRFEREISRIASIKKFDGGYILNGDFDSFRDKRLVVFLPYCLKDVDCNYRVKHHCDFTQEICDGCVVAELNRIFERHDIPYYIIINDSRDMKRSVGEYLLEHGDFDAVIAISCPRGILENKEYIEKHPVPVLFLMIEGWKECDFEKASMGKFWGKTELDMEKFHRAWSKCLSTLRSILQQDN